MSYVCDYCLKGVQYGESHTHGRGVAGGRWKKRAQSTRKVFKPNLHVARMEVDGKWLKVKLCTKCLRTLKVVKPTLIPAS
jgi:large subunit ribosomal protein L28